MKPSSRGGLVGKNIKKNETIENALYFQNVLNGQVAQKVNTKYARIVA